MSSSFKSGHEQTWSDYPSFATQSVSRNPKDQVTWVCLHSRGKYQISDVVTLNLTFKGDSHDKNEHNGFNKVYERYDSRDSRTAIFM